MALSNIGRRGRVGAEMYMVTVSFLDPGGKNAFYRFLGGAVVENFWGFYWFKAVVYLDRMALVGSDFGIAFAERKALFRIGGNNFFEYFPIDG